MRVLLLLRGAPGVGKSTWISENGLKPYTISTDDLRIICESPVMDINGKDCIGMDYEKFVWKTLFEILEFRMQRGDFTVIDATNSKSIEMNRYKQLADMYRYRMFCVDMTDVPIEECKRRNANRELLRRVPEESIDKMYARFRTQKIPSGIKVIKPDELDKAMIHKIDLSEYKEIIHIGDIHGCHTALKELFPNGIDSIEDDKFYIFLGDYIDRGIENVEVLKFLCEIRDKKNVLMLEGNHERWINIYAHGGVGNSKEFELQTRKQLDEANFDLKELRMLYRKLGQMAYYTYHGKTFFVSHGGIPTIPEKNLTYMASHQFIHGVGKYDDFEYIAKNWDKTTPEDYYQIYGHRNTKAAPVQITDRCFCLEGKVEFGGHLRVLKLGYNEEDITFTPIEIKNDVFASLDTVEQKNEAFYKNKDISDFVMKLKQNRHIQEKEFGDISSFNFTRDAFFDKIWNDITTKARGLYINTKSMEIVARGYNKFFNINEMPETKFNMLQFKLQFPVKCYKKENGYLGLVSYNSETDDLFITTKSNPEGDYAKWLAEALSNKLNTEQMDTLKNYVKENKCTLLFENVDQIRDPHIIKYPQNELYLLDAVNNDINFDKISYEDLQELANKLGLPCKELAYTINNWQEFFDWYNIVIDPEYKYKGKNIEGFVIEDSAGYMVKLKLTYYNFWKFMRNISHETIRKGYVTRTGALTTDLSNDYYGWIKNLVENTPKEERENIPTNIIDLRDLFYKDHPEYNK